MIADIYEHRDGQRRSARYKQYDTPRLSNRFFGAPQMLALATAILVMLVLLFPRALINDQLRAGTRPTAATLAYLQLQLRAEPGDASLRLRLARAQLSVGQLEQAAASLEPLVARPSPVTAALWLHLQRARYVAAQPGSDARATAREAYRRSLRRLAPQLAAADLLAETRHAIGTGLYDTAAELATRQLEHARAARRHHAKQGNGASGGSTNAGSRELRWLAGVAWRVSPSAKLSDPDSGSITVTRSLSAEDIREQAFRALLESRLAAGDPVAAAAAAQRYVGLLDAQRVDWPYLLRIARWADNADAGSALALRWLRAAQQPAQRWTAFRALINAQLAAGRPRQALVMAQAHLQRVPHDRRLWRLMTQLAMQAGDAAQTAAYARRMVDLDSADAH